MKARARKLLPILLPIILLIAAVVAWFVTRTPPSSFDHLSGTGTPPADLIRRGEYVARLGDCVACHSTPKGAPFAGSLKMATPMGSIFASNITPDKDTGIGSYSLADFDRSVRRGVARDGHRLYPAMPYPSFAKLTDEDVRALYAFFMNAVVPVRQENRKSDIPWPLNMRWPLALWNAVFVRFGTFQQNPSRDAQWNRGAYLVQGPGHCGACHTQRGLFMNEKALDERSSHYLSGGLLDGWYAPSLRSDINTGLGRWSEEEIHQFLKTGRNRHAVVFGSMTDAFNNSTQYMTDNDLSAIARYLIALPGDRRRDGSPWRYNAASNNVLALGNRSKTEGAQTYIEKCSFCHGVDGRGQERWIPSVAGSASSMVKENASLINLTLNGSGRIVANGVPDAYRMPPLRSQLSDREIADALSFVRSSWGNRGGAVTPSEVRALRARTSPASSNVVVLQMR